MKILHVVPTYYPAFRYGGPIRSVHGLAAALAAQGHDVHVYTTNVDGKGVLPVPSDRPVMFDGVTIWYYPTSIGRRFYRSPRMREALTFNVSRFDIVHLHSVFLWPTSVAALAARKAGVPYVLSPRGMLVGDLIHRKSSLAKRSWIALFERRNIENAAAVHLTSETEASELTNLGFRCARLAVVANGIELPSDELPKGNSDVAFADGAGRPYVLFLGRLNWKKGLDRLIPAMKYVENADLLIAGNDEENYRPKLEALARRCDVVDRVRFLGSVHGKKKWALLSSAQMLLLPSYSENFGNVVLEAMAAGCAVIVTPEVGMARMISETGCGVVAAGNPENLGLEIKRLLDDHERRRFMGEAGRRTVEAKYSWNIIGKQMLKVYTDILTGLGRDLEHRDDAIISQSFQWTDTDNASFA
jgi:glycosyltransferase involved in cell wall biosynthesis